MLGYRLGMYTFVACIIDFEGIGKKPRNCAANKYSLRPLRLRAFALNIHVPIGDICPSAGILTN